MHGLDYFFAMGGYAAFVWPAYGLAAAILIGNLWYSVRQRRQLQKRLANKVQHESLA